MLQLSATDYLVDGTSVPYELPHTSRGKGYKASDFIVLLNALAIACCPSGVG